MKKLRTHYDNLKVSQRATDAEIRQSYRRLASLHHPDKNANSDSSIRAMQCINKAYEVLSCPDTRAEHDKWIEVNEYGCKQESPSPTAHKSPSGFQPGFGEKASRPKPKGMFDPDSFPPKNWNPEHFTAFAKYSQAMRRLLDYEIKEYAEYMTLDVLYRAFLMDKRLGNLTHTNRTTARESLIRSFSQKQRVPYTVSQWLKAFNGLDPQIRKAVALSGLITLSLIAIFVL